MASDSNPPSPEAILKRYFGYDSFRPNQKSIIDAVLSGGDVLAVMPTGAGKSICYQVPALALGGLTLVVSPLISLMKDQVNALDQAGIKAAFLNSTLTPKAQAHVLAAARKGAYTLLYVTPERLCLPVFLEFCRACPPSMVAIDEAHCISQWGQDFRPSYMRINEFLEALDHRPPVCAFTATATHAVRDDILSGLALRNPLVVVASFDRPNLHFGVMRPRKKETALLDICGNHAGQCGIVYCTSRRAVEEQCAMLQNNGFAATRYHAGLSAGERQQNQDDFLYDRASIMVATNAFGMGIDKSNVSFVVHFNMPLDVESYYQEAGRAGRDGEPAECVLLYAPKDVRTNEWLLDNGFSESADIDGPTRRELLQRAHERLRQMTFYSTTQDCLRAFLLRYFGEASPAFCGNCSNCETQFEQQDITVEAQKIISCVYRLQQRGRSMGKSTVTDILRGSKAAKILDAGFDDLSTYGIMSDVSTHRVRYIIDRLIEMGLLSFTGGDYPTVQVNAESAAFLKEKRTLQIKVPKERPRNEHAKRERAARRGTEDASNPTLFQALKELRASIAAQEGVPAYVVFSNHTLHDMCRLMPVSEDDFLEVSGVGQVKAQKYAEPFLACIAQHGSAE